MVLSIHLFKLFTWENIQHNIQLAHKVYPRLKTINFFAMVCAILYNFPSSDKISIVHYLSIKISGNRNKIID